jgi:predicted DNA-binding transcriptional regulator AlpA
MQVENHSHSRDIANPTGFLTDLIDAEELCSGLKITRATLAKLEADPESAFPSSLKLGQKTYFHKSAVRAWIAMRTGVDSED